MPLLRRSKKGEGERLHEHIKQLKNRIFINEGCPDDHGYASKSAQTHMHDNINYAKTSVMCDVMKIRLQRRIVTGKWEMK